MNKCFLYINKTKCVCLSKKNKHIKWPGNMHQVVLLLKYSCKILQVPFNDKNLSKLCSK